ncbi:hypothetical protein FOL47_006253 [Perkinsus chesapeaki]|uniref:Uncharacterized protein n=1 Tax=Perkinsus chesapeaki TaxID=330153 RepID=A0A7J6LT37_PERCH|nr:hypothetical protein FOL47_006253 [Perkinsus chesapeaki]
MASYHKSIIGFDCSLVVVPCITLLVIWCLAGFDLAISGLILFLSLLAVWWMFTDPSAASSEPESAPVQPSLSTTRRIKKARKVALDEVMGSTSAGIELAPRKIDRSVGTDDLYEVPIVRKELSRAARRRRNRKERLTFVDKESKEVVGEVCKEPAEERARTPSTAKESTRDETSDQSQGGGWHAAAVDDSERHFGDESFTVVTQEVSQGPPTPKRVYTSVSQTSSTSASHHACHLSGSPPVLPPPFPPPEHQYLHNQYQQQQHPMGYYAAPAWFAPPPVVRFVPLLPPGLSTPYEPALARRVRWVGADELRIEMAGVWAGLQGKWRATAMSHWLKWLMSQHLPCHPEEALKPLLDLDLSRNDLTDKEFEWMVEELEQCASIVRLRASHNQLTEHCTDTLSKLLASSEGHLITEIHLNGNLLGDEGASALLTAVAKILSDQETSDKSPDAHPLWLRLDDNGVDNSTDILVAVFGHRPGQYCLALPGSPCTLERCANGSLVHLFNFAKMLNGN